MTDIEIRIQISLLDCKRQNQIGSLHQKYLRGQDTRLWIDIIEEQHFLKGTVGPQLLKAFIS